MGRRSADIDRVRAHMEPVIAPRFLDAYLPLRRLDWFGLVIGLLFCAVPFAMMVSSYGQNDPEAYVTFAVFAVMFYTVGNIIAFRFPSGIEVALHAMRNDRCGPIQFKYARGPNGERTQPSPHKEELGNSEGWLAEPPPISDWHLEDPYAADDEGLLADHPLHVGSPVPATFTVRSLIRLVQSLVLVASGMAVFNATGAPGFLYGVLLMAAFALTVNAVKLRGWRRLADRPTSTVRSLPMGPVEVFGQLRPRTGWPGPVWVDGDASKSAHGMALWEWRHGVLQTWEEYVEEHDENNNVTGGRWESRSSFDLIRSATGGVPVVLHDGTGGVAVDTNVLTWGLGLSDRKSWQQKDMNLWTGPLPPSYHRRNPLAALNKRNPLAARNRREPVISHNIRNIWAGYSWVISGWAVGDPLFASCYAVPRSREELMSEGVDQSVASSLPVLTVDGDAPGHSIEVHRGTELLTFEASESALSALLPAASMAFVALVGLFG